MFWTKLADCKSSSKIRLADFQLLYEGVVSSLFVIVVLWDHAYSYLSDKPKRGLISINNVLFMHLASLDWFKKNIDWEVEKVDMQVESKNVE